MCKYFTIDLHRKYFNLGYRIYPVVSETYRFEAKHWKNMTDKSIINFALRAKFNLLLRDEIRQYNISLLKCILCAPLHLVEKEGVSSYALVAWYVLPGNLQNCRIRVFPFFTRALFRFIPGLSPRAQGWQRVPRRRNYSEVAVYIIKSADGGGTQREKRPALHCRRGVITAT